MSWPSGRAIYSRKIEASTVDLGQRSAINRVMTLIDRIITAIPNRPALGKPASLKPMPVNRDWMIAADDALRYRVDSAACQIEEM